jgi:hypothetical protein
MKLRASATPARARAVCATGTASHGSGAGLCNKLSATCAMRPSDGFFLSYIGLPDRLDSRRVVRLRSTFKVQGFKFKVSDFGVPPHQ